MIDLCIVTVLDRPKAIKFSEHFKHCKHQEVLCDLYIAFHDAGHYCPEIIEMENKIGITLRWKNDDGSYLTGSLYYKNPETIHYTIGNNHTIGAQTSLASLEAIKQTIRPFESKPAPFKKSIF